MPFYAIAHTHLWFQDFWGGGEDTGWVQDYERLGLVLCVERKEGGRQKKIRKGGGGRKRKKENEGEHKSMRMIQSQREWHEGKGGNGRGEEGRGRRGNKQAAKRLPVSHTWCWMIIPQPSHTDSQVTCEWAHALHMLTSN